jgi:hypothetical protein
VKDQSVELFNMEDALVFEVHDARFGEVQWHGKVLGAVRPVLDWSTELVRSSELEPKPPVLA